MTLFDSVQVALGQFNDFFFVSLLYQCPKKATKVNSFNITKTGLTSLFVLNTFNGNYFASVSYSMCTNASLSWQRAAHLGAT